MTCPFNDVVFSARTGCVFRFTTILKDSAGAVMNLTGYGANFQIKRDLADASPTLALSSGSGITITALNGLISLEITSTQSAALTGDYFYTLTVTEPSTKVVHLFSGKITFDPVVTP